MAEVPNPAPAAAAAETRTNPTTPRRFLGLGRAAASPVGLLIQQRFMDYFSNRQRTSPSRRERPRRTWSNAFITFIAYLVFLFCFGVEVWTMQRNIKSASGDNGSSVMSRSENSSIEVRPYTSTVTTSNSFSTWIRTTQGTSTVAVHSSSTTTSSAPTTTPTSENRDKVGETEKSDQEGEPSRQDDDAKDCEASDCSEAEDNVPWRRALHTEITSIHATARHRHSARALRAGITSNVTACCLYYDGGSVAKHGGFATALSVLYSLWIMLFILILLVYERRRLRFDRHVHSAAVVGTIEVWMATEYLTRGVESVYLACAGGIYICAFFNLYCGLPSTRRRRHSLFPYLLRRNDRPGPVVDGRYVPDNGELFGPVKQAAEYSEVAKRDVGPSTLVPAINAPLAATQPLLGLHMPQEDRERMAKVLPAQIAAGVPGGVAQLWHQNPQQEFWHRFMNSALQGDGSGQTGTGGGGGVGMEKMMTMMMMMQMMNGGAGGQPGGMGMNPGVGPTGIGSSFGMATSATNAAPINLIGGQDDRGRIYGAAPPPPADPNSPLGRFYARQYGTRPTRPSQALLPPAAIGNFAPTYRQAYAPPYY